MRKKYKRRKTTREFLEEKVARARKASSKKYWMKRLTSWAMGEGRKQSRRARWSFNRKRY